MNLDPETLLGRHNLSALRLARGRALPLGVGAAVLLHQAWCASHRLMGGDCDCFPQVRCSLPPLRGSATRTLGIPDRFAYLIEERPKKPEEERPTREREDRRKKAQRQPCLFGEDGA